MVFVLAGVAHPHQKKGKIHFQGHGLEFAAHYGLRVVKNLPAKRNRVPPPSVAEKALIEEMTQRPASVTRLSRLSDYFLEQKCGPQRMLETIQGMLAAEVPRYNHETEKIEPMPDWKVRERGVWLLYKIHMDFVNDKTMEAMPPQFVTIIRDFQSSIASANPKELDSMYGVVE